MSGSFDPYARWLNIAAKDQRANHYRLLGLPAFEESRQKIDDSVAKRAEFLQNMSLGEHVKDAQKLLNEVARARICLVNPVKKEAYDKALRMQLNEAKSGGKPAAIPLAAVIGLAVSVFAAVGCGVFFLIGPNDYSKTLADNQGTKPVPAAPKKQPSSKDFPFSPEKVGQGEAIVESRDETKVKSTNDLGKEPAPAIVLNKTGNESRRNKRQARLAKKRVASKAAAESKAVAAEESKANVIVGPRPTTEPNVITWQQSKPISRGAGNSSDVANGGTLIEAVNATLGDFEDSETSNVIVNGVAFETAKLGHGNDQSGNVFLPKSIGDQAYDHLLTQASFGDELNEFSVGHGKLKSGRTYLIQVWYADARASFAKRSMKVSDSLGNPCSLKNQYAIGFFNADDSGELILRTQGIETSVGKFESHLNAYQIRDITSDDGKEIVAMYRSANTLAENKAKVSAVPANKKAAEPKANAVAQVKKLKFALNPFRAFPKQIELGPIEDTKPIKVAALYIDDATKLALKLYHQKSPTKSGIEFDIEKEGDLNRWALRYRTEQNKSPLPIAVIEYSNYELNFQWLPEAGKSEDINFVRNGVLEFSTSPEAKGLIGLRTPERLGEFRFSKNGLSAMLRKEISYAPPTKVLEIQAVNFPVSKFGKQYWEPRQVGIRKPATAFFEKAENDRFVELNVSGGFKGGKLNVKAMLEFRNTENDGPIRDVTEFVPLIQLMNQQVSSLERRRNAAKPRDVKAKLDVEIKERRRLLGVGKNYQSVAKKLLDTDIGIQVSQKVAGKRFVIAQSGKFRSEFVSGIKELGDYQLVYELDLKKLAEKIEYQVDLRGLVGEFDRVGYWVTLVSRSGTRMVFVSFKAPTKDINKIGVPTVDSKASFQTRLEDMNVFSHSTDVTSGMNIESGFMEFWPNRYSPAKPEKMPAVKTASPGKFDFGDTKSVGKTTYGSMQIHNVENKQTLFAINHWGVGEDADLGIGNNKVKAGHPDWTHSKSAKTYSSGQLRVYVRPVE